MWEIFVEANHAGFVYMVQLQMTNLYNFFPLSPNCLVLSLRLLLCFLKKSYRTWEFVRLVPIQLLNLFIGCYSCSILIGHVSY
jgi:hypothetical protein